MAQDRGEAGGPGDAHRSEPETAADRRAQRGQDRADRRAHRGQDRVERREQNQVVRHERVDRWEAAALRAEYETGRRERTEQAARTNIVLRLARMSLASLILVAGVLMLALPGPGWLAIAAGLALLSKDVAWAERLLRYIRRRIPGVPEDGRVPRSAIVTAALLAAAGVAGSVWWFTT